MKQKILSLFNLVKNNWSTAPEGRYMPFKEIVSLSAGGIGVKFIMYCVSNMIISIGNSLIGNTIGIDPSAIYVIYIISVLSGFPLTALRARMIDNCKSSKGKYRPYILSMGIPTVILGILFIWMPYESMSLTSKCVAVLLFNIGFQFFYNFYTDAYDSLINVLSPNTIERTDVYAVKSVIENLSPSIASIFLPIVAKLITGDNTLYDLRVYRYLYPPMLIVGFIISVLVYVNTEERIVQSGSHVIRISFIDAFRAVVKNKYFWIISLAGWIGFLENSFNTIMGWMYNYQAACSAGQYAIITAIAGNASLWPNLFAPYLIRKFGKKNVLIFSNIMNIFFIFLMLPVIRMKGNNVIWVLLVFTFVNQLLTSLGHFMNPSLNADIRDYQQYITGERIDGMFSAVGLIGSVISLATNSVLPAIYESAGLNKSVAISLGYDGSNVYDVLYDNDYFVHICSVLIIASVIGAALNVIPFFFYDLTETKQRAMITVLKIRAMFEDYGNRTLSDKSLVESMDIINEAKLYKDKNLNVISNDDIKAAKKSKDKKLVESLRNRNKLLAEENEKIIISQYVTDELNKFTTDEGKEEIRIAEIICEAGVNGFMDAVVAHSNSDFVMSRKSAVRVSKKTIAKYYPDSVSEFDASVFDKLFADEDRIEKEIRDILYEIKSANENNDKIKRNELKITLEQLRIEKSKIKNEIKLETKKYNIYNRAVKVYLDAQRIMTQYKNYNDYEKLTERYNLIKSE